MRRIEIVFVTSMLAIVGGSGIARAGQVSILEHGHTLTHDCGDAEDVAVFGSKNQITLRGTCAMATVMGSGNMLRIESVGELAIAGSRNTVDVAATDTIAITGHDNRVSYARGRSSKAPKTSSLGKRNVIKRVGELPGSTGGDAAPAPDDKPEAGATLRDAKPIVCERNDRVKLDGVLIRTDGVAITTEGSCWLTITNSKIISTGSAAMQTMGSTIVTLENVELEGKQGAAMNAGSAYVTIKRSTLRGRLAIEGSSTVRLANSQVHGARNVTSSATYIDGGGNTFHKP